MNAIVNFVTTIPITNIHPFEDTPYKVQDNAEMQFLCESIRENEVLSPLLVRKIGAAEEYELISSHRRLYTAHKIESISFRLRKPLLTNRKQKRCPIKVLLVDRPATSPAMRFPIPTAAARTGTMRCSMNALWTAQGNNFRMNISGTEYEVSTHFDSSGTVHKCETVPLLI